MSVTPEFKQLTRDIMSSLEGYKKNQEKLERRLDNLEATGSRPVPFGPISVKTAGELFIESDSVKPYVGKKANEIWHRNLLIHSHVGNIWPQGKAAITSGNVGTDVIQSDRAPGIVPLPVQPLRIRDLMVSNPTSSPIVEYLRENSFTNGASPQVEGQVKGESAINFSIENETARTLAHWIPATKQVLDDFSGLRAYVDSRLLYGLKLVEEKEILAGDGTGQHLSGLIANSTSYDTGLNASGDTSIDRIRKAILQLELANEMADGIVLNPVDYAEMELAKDAENRYLISTPTGPAMFSMLWRRPVVSSSSIAEGTFLVGAFGSAAHIWDRQDATIEVSNSHSDYFVRNMVAIRCEERICLTVERPGSFVYGSF